MGSEMCIRDRPRSGGANVLIGVAIGAVAAAVVGTILLRVRPIKETDAGVDEAIDTSIPGVDV